MSCIASMQVDAVPVRLPQPCSTRHPWQGVSLQTLPRLSEAIRSQPHLLPLRFAGNADGVQVLAADKQKYTMRVGAGMRYTELFKEAEKAGMSVKVSNGCWAGN